METETDILKKIQYFFLFSIDQLYYSINIILNLNLNDIENFKQSHSINVDSLVSMLNTKSGSNRRQLDLFSDLDFVIAHRLLKTLHFHLQMVC